MHGANHWFFGGMWLWWLLALVVVAGLVYLGSRRKNRTDENGSNYDPCSTTSEDRDS